MSRQAKNTKSIFGFKGKNKNFVQG